jgi:hypothetical protein
VKRGTKVFNYDDPTKLLDIRPCLCGRTPVTKDYGMLVVLLCRGCGTQGPTCDTEQAAIVGWNAHNVPGGPK